MKLIILFCSVICLLAVTAITAQSLPKNPTVQQVVGYRMVEQQRWNSQQLPKNSVLYIKQTGNIRAGNRFNLISKKKNNR